MSTNNSWNAPSLGAGQVYIGQSSGLAAAATITGSLGVTVTSTSGAINISGSGGGFTWFDTTGGSATLAANSGYLSDSGSLTTFTMPATAAIGDTYIVHGKGAGGWQVNVVTGQTIHFGSSACTTSTGNLASTNQYDSITITCITANTTFACRAAQGNITVA